MSNIRTRLADAVSLAIGRDPFALCSSDEIDRMGELAASAVLSLPGIAIVDTILFSQIDELMNDLAHKYDDNKLSDHARGVRHAQRVVAAVLLAAANAAEADR
jgi:hypothetical protein